MSRTHASHSIVRHNRTVPRRNEISCSTVICRHLSFTRGRRKDRSHILVECYIFQCSGHFSSVQEGTVNITFTVASHENVRHTLESQPRTTWDREGAAGWGDRPSNHTHGQCKVNLRGRDILQCLGDLSNVYQGNVNIIFTVETCLNVARALTARGP